MIAFNDDPEFVGKLCRRRSDPDIRRAPPVPPPVPRIREQAPEEVATAFFASLLIPGLGQLIKGHVGLAVVCFVAAVIVWWPLTVIWPIVVVHLAAAVNTLSRK
ncbi:MAG: hypothetical protein WC299_06420 [Kiritimatiellia bacterium]